MRVAVCFTGHMRTYRQTYDSWNRHVIAPFNADIFIDTWNTIGPYLNKDSQIWIPGGVNKFPVTEVGTVSIDSAPIDRDEIELTYSPKKFNVEDYNTEVVHLVETLAPIMDVRNDVEDSYERLIFPLGHYSQMYKWWKCNQLKSQYEAENDMKYDVVIRSRTDLMLNGSLEPFIENAAQNLEKIFIPYRDDGLHPLWMKDVFFMGSSLNMDTLCDIYTKFDEFVLRKNPETGKFWGYHDALARHFLSENLMWEEMSMPISPFNHCLIR